MCCLYSSTRLGLPLVSLYSLEVRFLYLNVSLYRRDRANFRQNQMYNFIACSVHKMSSRGRARAKSSLRSFSGARGRSK